MKRVALYARVSTDEQKKHGYSIAAQVDELREYAKTKGYKVVDEYVDEGISGGTLKRPHLQRLLKDIEAHKIDLVVFTKLDRWFRSVSQYHKIQEVLESHNVEWICTQEDYETITSSGKFKVNIMLSVSQQFKDATSERIKSVFDYKAKNGFYLTGAVPFGYKTERIYGGIIVVKDLEKAPIVDDFYIALARTNSIYGSQVYVNSKYGLSLSRKTVDHFIDNTLYSGRYRNIDNFCEPYITPEFQDKLIEIRKSWNIKKNTDRTYIFSGMLRCAHCGWNFAGATRKYANKDGSVRTYKAYRCPKNSREKICKNTRTMFESKLETILLDTVRLELEQYVFKIELTRKTKKVKSVANREEIEKEIKRLNNMYQKGRIEEYEYDSQYEELNSKLMELQKEKEVNIEPLKQLLNTNFETLYTTMTDENKRLFWRSFIDYIEMDSERNLSIHFLG